MITQSERSEQIARIITILTAMSVSAGFFIVNLYLGKFGISDYGLLNAKAILTGILFILIEGISIVLILFNIKKDAYELSLKDFFSQILIRPIYLTNLFFLLFVYKKEMLWGMPTFNIFEYYDINVGFLIILALFFTMIGLMYRFFDCISGVVYKDAVVNRFIKRININLTISVLILPCLVIYFNGYGHILAFFLINSFLVKYSDLFANAKCFRDFFKNGFSDLMRKIIIGCTGIILFFIISAIYSQSIYPFIKEQYGGGATNEISIKCKDGNIIEGSLLHKDEARFYLLNDKNEVLIVEVSDIKIMGGIKRLGIPLPRG